MVHQKLTSGLQGSQTARARIALKGLTSAAVGGKQILRFGPRGYGSGAGMEKGRLSLRGTGPRAWPPRAK